MRFPHYVVTMPAFREDTLASTTAQLRKFIYQSKLKICINYRNTKNLHSKTADSDTVSTYQVSSVQLVTDKKLEAFNKAGLSYALLKASSFLSVTNCTEET